MEGIRERYEKDLSQRAEISEESESDGDRDGKGDNDGDTNIVLRLQ